jgi:hypothetical protein
MRPVPSGSHDIPEQPKSAITEATRAFMAATARRPRQDKPRHRRIVCSCAQRRCGTKRCKAGAINKGTDVGVGDKEVAPPGCSDTALSIGDTRRVIGDIRTMRQSARLPRPRGIGSRSRELDCRPDNSDCRYRSRTHAGRVCRATAIGKCSDIESGPDSTVRDVDVCRRTNT